MPLAPLVPALIGAGTSLVNAGLTGTTNRASRKFAEKMYARQRKDNLADWEMQNSYNSPAAQMARFRDAGLNPHLIYGQANEGATLHSADKPSWTPQAPQVDFTGASLVAGYDINLREAQTDNLRATNDLLLMDKQLKALTAAQMVLQNKKLLQDTDQGRELFKYTIDAAVANISETRARTDRTIQAIGLDKNADERAALTTSSNIMEAAARIVSMRISNAKIQQEIVNLQQALKNMQQDEKLKEWDIKMREKGIDPGDPGYWRVGMKLIDGAIGDAALNKDQRSYLRSRGFPLLW